MQDCREKLARYSHKCQQHLTRVWLSQKIALRGLKGDGSVWNENFADLVAAAFDRGSPDRDEARLRRGLCEVHLIALKANFELYLNRILTTAWIAGFEEFAASIPQEIRVSTRQIAGLVARDTNAVAAAKAVVVGRIVGAHGLMHLMKILERTTAIKLEALLEHRSL